jgi:transposase-like protein
VPGLLTVATECLRLDGDAPGRAEAEPMDFPLKDYLDEEACYRKLVELLHPEGLACPRCGQPKHLGIHDRHREPALDYQCGACGRVFNAWTGTVLQGTHRRPREILLILHGVATGEPTARMARELGCDRKHLLELRHRLQEHARRWLDRNPLDDAAVEADELYQNAGEKRRPARRPGRPAATAGQPPPGPRHLRQRPAAGRRGGRPGVGRGPA